MIEQVADVEPGVKLRYGMVGGGQGSFIGDVHRKSIALDGLAEIAAGCFSRSVENTLKTGAALGLSNERLYKDFEEMAREEAKRPDKIDFVVITAQNYAHYETAKAFLSRGIPVVCEKPLCFEVSEAEELAALAKQNNLLFCVTYVYTGNATAKQAREIVRRGEIGKIIYINGEYPQEWLLAPAEKQGSKQAEWRTDPKQAGKSNSIGDIGTHVENMISYVTGLKIKSLLARLDKLGPGDRVLDDNATVLLEYDNGAKGVIWTSQVAAGYDNGMRLRIFGTKGSIELNVESSNYLKLAIFGGANAQISRGRDPFYPHAQSYSRIPSGHPEGYFEAMANLYKTYIKALVKQKEGKPLTDEDLDFPNVEDGIAGVKFIGKCVESSAKGAVWVNF
ncbi:oxidoreductase [Spirochaetia bacterium]|nr:oxidoreductase [Spirochaetia bacterium]